ncbi:M24 family metallopeptidase [Streptomyces sp. 4F14]|uniref:M24 family metallopeptidase n=1 Tax=Streptomyces sp. 4F14 TaxID=3394380 RepID=UPI003A844C0F
MMVDPVHRQPITIDVKALQAERLARAQAGMKAAGLAAALLFDPANVRYATCDGQFLVANLHCPYRWALVFAEHDPILWDGAEQVHLSRLHWGGEIRTAEGFAFFGSGLHSRRVAKRAIAEVVAALQERGLREEPLGVDRVDAVAFLELAAQGIEVIDAVPVLETARAVKTPTELDVHRDNARLVDEAVAAFLHHLKPGRTENELWADLAHETFSHGALHAEARLLCSGPRTNPWMQEATHRVVQNGDLVAFDTDLVGPFGYLTDISRTYLCGDRPATAEQREVYRAAYEFVHESIPEFVAGRSFAELGEMLGKRIPEKYRQQRYPFIAHGCGAADEYPVITMKDHHPGMIESGMVLSVEGYMGAVGGTEGAKFEEQIIVTEGAPELISHAPADERLLT